MKIFNVIARVAFFVALALAGIIWVTTYLVATNASGSECAGHELRFGYRVRDFLALSVVAVGWVAVVGHLVWGRSQMLRSFFEGEGVPVLKLKSKSWSEQCPHTVGY